MKKEKKCQEEQLRDFYRSGLQVQVEDVTVNEQNLQEMDQLVREDDCYMKDFVEDSKGEIYRVHYIKVTQH
jgi:Zn/Cd-binding protein ZinT